MLVSLVASTCQTVLSVNGFLSDTLSPPPLYILYWDNVLLVVVSGFPSSGRWYWWCRNRNSENIVSLASKNKTTFHDSQGSTAFFLVGFFFFLYWRRSSRELHKNCTVCLSRHVEGREDCLVSLFCFSVFRTFTSRFLDHWWVSFHLWLSSLGLCCRKWRLTASAGSLCSVGHCCPNYSLQKMSSSEET